MKTRLVTTTFLALALAASACATSAPNSPPAPASPPPTAEPAPDRSGATTIGGIEITVYYTAVESFHGGETRTVKGCLIRECEFGNSIIGTYPKSFVRAVKTEGTGRITSGVHTGRYLNWSWNVGYWVEDIPSDSYGDALVAMKTAAADIGVLRRGTRFAVLAPLTLDNGETADAGVAAWIAAGKWEINDEFTPGLGGAGHIDLYLGEEDRPNYTRVSPLYQHFINARIAVLD